MSDETVFARYPEHAKMMHVAEESQAIGEFLENSDYVLAEYIECARFHVIHGDTCSKGSHLVPVGGTINQVLAKHFDINLDAIEAEKRAMLAAMRQQ